LTFDRETFAPESLLAAGYRFTDKFSVAIVPAEEGRISVSLEPKPGSASLISEDLVGAFTNEAIDQQIRLNLEAKTGHLRDIITEFAFNPLNAQLQTKKKP